MRGRTGRIAVVLVLAVVATAALASAGVGTAAAGGQPVVIGGTRPSSPVISGSQVVWADKYDGNWDIFLYDGLSGQTTRLTSDANDQAMPSLSGNRLVYADYSTGTSDIMVRTLPGGATTRIAVSGDQTDPTISGDWVAWEDHSTRSGRIEARNLVTGTVYRLGADNGPAERPRIAGNLLVYEDHSLQYTGRTDPDVVVLNLATGFSTRVATSIATEYYAETDGRYVVWSEGTAEGYKIRGFDTATSSYTDISSGPGEQTMPAIAGGKVYWIDNVGGQPLHVDTFDFGTGESAPFYAYSSGDVVGLVVSGTNVAWLETAGTRMRVRAVFNEGVTPMARVAAFFSPITSLVDSLQLATLSTGGDMTAPEVSSTSVQPGEKQVSKTAGVSVYFDEALDPATVNGATIGIIDAATGGKVPATVRYSALANMATVKPDAPLADGTYTLAVDPVVTDAAGNALGEQTLVSFSTVTAAADVGVPSAPGLNGAKVSGLSSIEMSWTASTDDVAINGYDIYRRAVAMSRTDMAGAELAATVASTTLSTTFAVKGDEAAKSYTYYYVVVARDSVDHTSSPSVNIAPNPHGTYSTTANTANCTRCHFVHGGIGLSPKLGARSAAACYKCHGSTPGNDTFGSMSTMDSQGLFNDDSGIAPGGSSGTGNDGWSIHRTDNMSGSSFGRECDACHSPHRKSYDADPALSYGRMLRKASAPVYGTDAVPSDNTFCYECHGTGAMGYMDSFGGDGTYAGTGGSHNMTATVSGAAHSSFNVYSKLRATRPNGGNLPQISCLACHNEHASPNRALIDYRMSNTKATTYDQSGLCFACHKAASVENAGASKQSSGTPPFTWGNNARNPYNDFTVTGVTGSRHPIAVGGGVWQATSGTVWSQTDAASFTGDTTVDTAINANDVTLVGDPQMADPAAGTYLFSMRTASTQADSYRLENGTTGIWNQDFAGSPIDDTTQFASASGSLMFAANGKVYRTRSTNTNPAMRVYTPPADPTAGSWATAVTTFTNGGTFGLGSQATVNNGASAVYMLRAGGTAGISWYRWDNGTTNNLNFTGNVGEGAGIAYAPGANRLFVVYRNGNSFTTGGQSGNIWFTDAPGTPNNTTPTWTNSGRAVSFSGSTAYDGRLVYFKDGGGAERLMYMGRNTGNSAWECYVVPTLTGATLAAPVALGKNIGALADGCDLVWDGVNGGFLYATRGGGTNGVYRIQIPSNASASGNWTGNWTAFTNNPPAAPNAGSGLAIVAADPLPYATGGVTYRTSGTLTTSEIKAPGPLTSWDTLNYSVTVPAGTTFSVKVQGSTDGATWTDRIANATNGQALSGIDVAANPRLRLVATFTSQSPFASTPTLADWSISAHWSRMVYGSYVPLPSEAFSQTIQADFNLDTLYQTVTNVADGNGSVILAQWNPPIDPASEPYLFWHDGGAQVMDQYRPADGTAGVWNTNYGNFNPPDNGSFSTASGSTLFSVDSKVYVTQAGTTNAPRMRAYTPPSTGVPNGAWADGPAVTNWTNSFGTGSQSTVNTASSVVYVSVGGQNTIQWWQYTGATGGSVTFRPGNNATVMGIGSGIAYSPTNDKLWVVNRNGGTGDGLLYYLAAPGTKTGTTQTWTSTTTQVTSNGGTSYYGRLVHFKDPTGTDCLMYVGRNSAGTSAYDTMVVTGLGNANPTSTRLGKSPFTMTDGCDLKWDGVNGGYIYAIQGGTNTAISRIQIPTGPGTALNWGNWTPFTNGTPAQQSAGSGIAFCTADPLPYAGTAQYRDSGTVTSLDILPVAGSTTWGSVDWTENEPANTSVNVAAQGWDGSSWVPLASSATSPIYLTGFTTAAYAKIRLVGTLATLAPTVSTPRLDAWAATSMVPTFVESGSVTCANCHNVHNVGNGGTGYWSVLRISDPDNTNLAVGDTTTFCLRCHDGAPPTATRSASVMVPYSVGFSAISSLTSPFFPGWNKAASGSTFTGSGHYTALVADGKALCENCHDPHASVNDRLVAWTRPVNVTWTGAAPSAGGRSSSAADSFEEDLCYKCHGPGTGVVNTGKAPGAPNVYTPAETLTYKHPVSANGTNPWHTDTEGAADVGSANRHSECVDCHNPHAAKGGVHVAGSSTAGEVLRGAVGVKPTWSTGNGTTASAYSPVTILPGGTNDYEAYLCFKCHTTYSGQPFTVTTGSGTYTSTDLALEFNPNNQSGHNVLGTTTAWPKSTIAEGLPAAWTLPPIAGWLKPGLSTSTKLTCSDCHTYSAGGARGPHGSSTVFILDSAYPTDYRTVTINGATATSVICAKCHVTPFNSNAYNDVHGDSNHNGYYCIDCHVQIPHGWKRPRLIGYTSQSGRDPLPYATRTTNSLRGIVNTGPGAYNTWSKSYCDAGCSTSDHPGNANPWP